MNIVDILSHGWLKGAGSIYFIDMELADFSLGEYIRYHDVSGKMSANTDLDISPSHPVLVERSCTDILRLHNVWTIISHILRGLEFLHKLGHVHRDIKPDNSDLSL